MVRMRQLLKWRAVLLPENSYKEGIRCLYRLDKSVTTAEQFREGRFNGFNFKSLYLHTVRVRV